MMDLPRLIILDVAHGNCAILQDTEGTVVIDCAHGYTLIDTLRQLGVSQIDRIIISHADEDHIEGFIKLLLDESITIKHIYLNPDGSKRTDIWIELRLAIADAKKRQNTKRDFLHTEMNGNLDVGQVNIQILAPSMDLVGQAGGLDLKKNKLNSNSVSAVIRLVYKARGVALLAGDIDDIGLNNLTNDNPDFAADVLIFPHHGGNASSGGKGNQEFTKHLCEKVQPILILFSNGRNKHNNPRKEIIEAVLDILPDVHIMCTQLAKTCSPETIAISPTHLNTLPSKGREINHCCGGTVVINLSETETTYAPNSDHRQFVKENIVSALCMRS
ncbi:ComEC/Rec2 family competence protein [Pseudanabaena sp. BC1403]|uniref:ComEC/Rec2 family competence protein n=1 Tax=Pseudanabaena sp. BC1403 TaxID=2043171 RepID=UPI0015E1B878|nr:MBL fold metallo-hydrolase [Pseudanabaena sp. BC1403]